MTDQQWKVFPAPYRDPDPAHIHVDMAGWGCGTPILLVLFTWLLTKIFGVDFSWFILLCATIPVGLIMYKYYLVNYEKEYEERKDRDKKSIPIKAENSTKAAYQSIEAGKREIDLLASHLDMANHAIRVAEHEFSERAFGPFWDAVEASAVALGKYKQNLVSVKNSQARYKYHNELRGLNHNFPAWNEVVPLVPDPTKTAMHLRKMVRKGQTDFEFANIFEHRRTRQVLIEGYKQLGEALEGIEGSVLKKFEEVRRALTT